MSVWDDAAWVASLFAVDPAGTGGVCLRSQVHPARDEWLRLLADLLPVGTPCKRIPCNTPDGRLLGGLDLTATLRANQPVVERGVLASCDEGVVIIAMSERLSAHTSAALSAVLDAGEVTVLRDAVSGRFPARVGMVALDEGLGADEGIPRGLLDRLAFCLDFEGLSTRAHVIPAHDAEDIRAARARMAAVTVDPSLLERLCGTAMALGVESPRMSLLALRAARAAAALDGRLTVSEADAVLAGRLVLAPRATQIPAPPDTAAADNETSGKEPGNEPSPQAAPAQERPAEQPAPASTQEPQRLEDTILKASQAAIPAGLLARLQAASSVASSRAAGAGRAGAQQQSLGRGRPAGVRSGTPRSGARLNVLETLRAAAPWQRLRARGAAGDSRLRILPGDFRVTIAKQRTRTLTIFALDASGSAALNRLAEAKGAVELLLADCYLRRDQVAVVGFRGRAAELLLPPTRSLLRAKRSLAGLPGGGATPLASAIQAGMRLGDQAQRRGETPTLVLLTDGRANMALDGKPGRESGYADAMATSRALRAAGIAALFVDTSPRPNPQARVLAAAMGARYVPLPIVSSHALSALVKSAAPGTRE